MKKKHLLKIVVAVVLCAAMVLPFVPITAEAEAVNNFDITNFEGLNFSLIGDSISTYTGVNDSATYNPAYYSYNDTSAKVHYSEGKWGVYRADTWWQQTVDTLGMNLLVNNSWSGSAIWKTRSSAPAAYLDRSAYLHKGKTNPDVIAMYLGTNDCADMTDISTMGTVNSTLFSNAEAYVAGTRTTTPASLLEAYAIMLYRSIVTYPNAEIYCFTLLPERYEGFNADKNEYDAFNAGVKAIVEHYTDQGVYLVDLFNDSGVHTDKYSREHSIGDNLHPNPQGMDAITNCLISSMIKNSKYMTKKGYSVTYDLANTYVTVGNHVDGNDFYGDVTAAVPGRPFSVEFYSEGKENIEYKVIMDGKDITHEAIRSNVLYIEKVTGDLEITAHDFDNFYWKAGSSSLVSDMDQGSVFSYNALTKQSTPAGTYTDGGVFDSTGISYKMAEPINLLHDRPWVLEFEAKGAFNSGVLLFSYYDTSGTTSNVHIFGTYTDGLIALGFADGSYEHYGVGVSQDAGVTDFGTAYHTYRMYNVVNDDGTNTVYLRVDGGTAYSMTQHYDGATEKESENANEFSGRDIIFNYMGTSNHPLRNCGIKWVKAYENGEPTADSVDEANNYRWAGVGEGLTSVGDDDFFTENIATLEMGSAVNGVHEEETVYSLEDSVNLRHNRPWTIEIKAKGDWGARASESPMVFSTVNSSGSSYPGAIFLWRNSGGLFAFGYNQGYTLSDTTADGKNRDYSYNNYGINLSTLGLSNTAFYVYRLQNEIAYNEDGSYKSNMVYLYVDDVKIGAMNNYYQNAYSTGRTDDWINGKDMVFSYMGNKNYPISGVTIDYIQVWENGYTVDAHRLQYLINNQLESNENFADDAWMAYKTAVDNAKELLKNADINQEKVDAAVKAIMNARNLLTTNYKGETKIYSVEVVTGDYSRLNKQTGLRIVTTPDVAQVCVGSQKLIINSSKIQKMLIDDVETEVKVWLVSFNYTLADEGKNPTLGINAWKTYDESHTGASTATGYAAHSSVKLYYTSNFVTDIQVSKNPTKTEYLDGETFDATDMVVQIKRKNSTDWETVTDYLILNPKLYLGDTSVTIEYEGARVEVTVTVTADE